MSSTISATNLGLQGIQKGMDGLRKNAHNIANQNNDTSQAKPALEDSLVNMKLDKLQVQASTKVIETSSEMIGSLIDIKA